MQLYGSLTSPYVRHCRVALLETGLACEFVPVDAADAKNRSPTRKIPYLEDGDLRLSDSMSILRHLREKAGTPFLTTVEELDLYCVASTLMDAAITVFYFQKFEQIDVSQSVVLRKHEARILHGLSELNGLQLPVALPLGDGPLRLACFLGWGLFRNRFSLQDYPKLAAFLELANTSEAFTMTAPPLG